VRAQARWSVSPVVLVATLCLFVAAAHGQLPQLPQFRASVTLIPVEVRVLDREGNPVPGLTRADFTIREDGKSQEIAHFESVAADGISKIARNFFIVLGRGRLNDPTKAVQALIDFVRTTVRPVDRVGVFAYNRVIEFTTNHEAVARFLEYYRDHHTATESGLVRDNATHVRPPSMSPKTLTALDAHFSAVPEVTGLVTDPPGGVGNNLSRFSDWHYLKTTLAYLTQVPGEKHVVVLTERQFPAPRQSDNPLENYFFKMATSARATLSFIHTGGMPAPTIVRSARFPPRQNLMPLLARLAQRDLAGQTGGTSAFFQYASKPLDALDRATRSYYVLGYYPIQEVLPEQYRRVQVSVQREGLTLLYRHGFQARPTTVSELVDSRQAISDTRMEEALARLDSPASSRSSGITPTLRLAARVARRTGDGETLKVEVAFDAWLTMFTKQDSEYVVDVDLTLLADDDQRDIIGEHRQRLHIVLTEAEYARTKRAQWPTFDIEFDVKGRAAFVRGVLYQFETDRVVAKRATVQR
jgi:VWFA-related protein